MFSLRTPADLAKVNTATKYPSIPTHHRIDPRGRLHEEPTVFTGPVIATEKCDGTNARVLKFPDGRWMIGSRKDLLAADGDLVNDPSHGIVDALTGLAETIPPRPGQLVALYLEVYGTKNLGAWKEYGDGEPAWKLFDAFTLDLDLLEQERETIASWREHGGQPFMPEHDLQQLAQSIGVQVTPRLLEIDGADLPASIQDMLAFMEPYRTTVAATGRPGLSEGLVLRDPHRRTITKARFQDYDRTLRLRADEARDASRAARRAAAATR
ncbi:RNA ligase family protein [Planomonospora sp. ID82291]|uniref:RNA ligase family protein n=1 Tax=Planomonospora sp. ID82291 TaxID=2738136 RepID=UPI0018C37A2A|nr:RNA ligase family protein [Planomonospora sp. ID82291]MBG0818264.1 hypothetical protein [Planomonospora sp. ID82291]